MEIKIDFSSVIDLAKLKELILYITNRSKEDVRFGAVKLNKILYYADFRAYRDFGKSITGAHYQHLAEGPAPKELLIAIGELQEEGAIEFEDRPYFNYVQKRIMPKRKPKKDNFTRGEVAIVDEVIEYLWNFNATEVTDLSHKEWGWRLTEVGEEIPYRTTWLSAEPLTMEQILNGTRLMEKQCV